MRLARLAITLAVMIAGVITTSPAATADVTAGCHASDGGYTCFYGPITVRRGTPAVPERGIDIVGAPSNAGYITWARATLVYAGGRPVLHHAVHLHHAVWLNPQQPDMTCVEPYQWPERFFASGKERTKIAMPDGYGYRWTGGSHWYLNYHLDSMHGTHRVFVKLKLGFVPQSETTGITGIRPVWLDVDNCADSEFDVPRDPAPGPNKRTWSFTMPEGGRFVTLAGHLHDGGRRLKLRNATTDQPMFTSRAIYEYRWNLKAMTTYSNDVGVQVAAGDALELTSVYNDTRDGPGELAWPDVMGIMVGAFVTE